MPVALQKIAGSAVPWIRNADRCMVYVTHLNPPDTFIRRRSAGIDCHSNAGGEPELCLFHASDISNPRPGRQTISFGKSHQ